MCLFSPCRQQALLAAISEKDANIALLELSASKKKKTQEEVMALRREKDRLMHQLKQQVGASRQTSLIPKCGTGPGRARAGAHIHHIPPIQRLIVHISGRLVCQETKSVL